MEFIAYPHRHADTVLSLPEHIKEWEEIKFAIERISDDQLRDEFEARTVNKGKSISIVINTLIHNNLTSNGWVSEVPIFHDPLYGGQREKGRWRLDFAKKDISVEVAFNHGEATSWNLLKPVLASELNHVEKAIQTKIGVMIFATEKMKQAGGFDGAVGTYEKAITYLKPLNNLLSVPIMLIGLLPPKTFKIDVRQEGAKKVGYIVGL